MVYLIPQWRGELQSFPLAKNFRHCLTDEELDSFIENPRALEQSS